MKIGEASTGTTGLICAVIVNSVDLKAAVRAKRAGADILEVRVDTFKDLDPETLKADFLKLKKASNLPIILTIRSKKEGSAEEIDDKERFTLFMALIPLSDAVDIELSSKRILRKVAALAASFRKKLIISYHNFKSSPTDAGLKKILDGAEEAGADIIKIAATVKKKGDFKRLAALLMGEKKLIVIAMGDGSRASRVFFPFLGSLVTYASITGATAPGQLNIGDMKRVYKILGH